MGDVPENEEKWDRLARLKKYECMRCSSPIPFGEREVYFEHKLCGYCYHMLQKAKEE